MSETYNGCDTTEYIAVPGPQGPQGQRGEQGLRGVPGPMGPQGEPGAVGAQGPCGPKGDRGPRGEKGDKGEPGKDGARGPEGPEGPRGCTGASGKVSFDQLTEEQRESLRGPMGPRGFQGERGERGSRGLTGPQGPQGLRGEQGAAGRNGENGPQGPKGDPGERGPIGPQGIAGPQGPAGESKGLSHSDHVSTDTTWNSKMITDFVNHGRVNWKYEEGTTLGVPDTSNGYIKDIVVRGNTQINHVNSAINAEPIQINTEQGQISRNLYDRTKAENDFIIPAGSRCTIIFSTKVTRDYLDDDNDHAIVDITAAGNKTTVSAGLKDGIVKIDTGVIAQEIQKIDIKVMQQLTHDTDVNFTASDFMVLIGNKTDSVAPRFFTGIKGVGDAIPGTSPREYAINIETRNKNLLNPNEMITDYYIKKDESVPGVGAQYRWAKGLKGDSASFLVYCKQGHYTLTLKYDNMKVDNVRFKVVGYKDVPTNGEPGTMLLDVEAGQLGDLGYLSRNFQVAGSINVLAVYIAKLRKEPHQGGVEEHGEYSLGEIFQEFQLEEGPIATNYEPYRSNLKALIVPRQIMHNESLQWDEHQGMYVIVNQAGGHEPTKIKTENFINAYKDRTYAYIKTKIPTVFGGMFPLEAEKGEYYNKAEWGFEGEELDHSKDFQNFLKLPNGLYMQWRRVDVTLDKNNPRKGEIHFLNAKKIVYVSVTPYGETGKTDWYSRVIPQIDSQTPGKVQLYLEGNYQSNTQEVHCMILVISDNRKAEL